MMDWTDRHCRFFHRVMTGGALLYTEMVAAGKLPPRPGIRRVISDAQDAGWTLAVASTSAEPAVRAILE